MKKKHIILFCILILIFTSFVACGEEESETTTFFHRSASTPASDDEDEEEEEEEDTETEYMIVELNMVDEYVTVQELGESISIRYAYSLSTKFLDKYGQRYSTSHFTSGQVVKLGELTDLSTLSSIQMSDDVWVYEDITNYEIDTDRGVFTIGSSNYRIGDTVYLYSGSEEITWEDISSQDALTVIGKDTDLISVMVTTGTGTIQLVNTEIFEGSLIFIGSTIITEITENMTISVPEGTYDVTVANDGYGGTASYTVARGETTEIDLDTLKGEGPKTCLLTLQTDVEGASVYIDGELISADEPVEVTYGTHSLTVSADGYDTWSRTLIVNSSTATISLELEETDTSSDDESDTSSDDESDTSSDDTADEDTSSDDTSDDDESDEDTSSSSSTLSDTEVDYLTTLSEMISSLL